MHDSNNNFIEVKHVFSTVLLIGDTAEDGKEVYEDL